MNNITNNNGSALIISILFVFALLISSCIKEEIAEQGRFAGLIKVTGQDASTATKTTLDGLATIWNINDEVGIFSPQARTESGGSVAVANAMFTATQAAKSSPFTGTMFWGEGAHNFYAYYPYNSEASSDATAVPIALSGSSQVQYPDTPTEHIGKWDFMVATPLTMTGLGAGAAGEISLKYNHVFTILEFQIKGTGNLKAIELVTPNPIAFWEGTIDITQIPVDGAQYTITKTGPSTTVKVELLVNTEINQTDALNVYMVIDPGIQAGICTINLFDGSNWKRIEKVAPEGGFIRGKKYTVPIDATTAQPLKIGDPLGGGKVAYFIKPGERLHNTDYSATAHHGLIVANEDQSDGIVWGGDGNQNFHYIGNEAIGQGLKNTGNINQKLWSLNYSYAAGIAAGYRGGHHGTWHLPSLMELNKLFLNKALFDMDGHTYWSSSQLDYRNPGSVYVQNFSIVEEESSFSVAFKNEIHYVRAVSYF